VDVVALTRALVDIPSADADESAIGDYLGDFLAGRGWTVERQEAAPHRPNLLATAGAPPRLVFSSHLDTVPPHVPAREDAEFVHGRGACDAKGIVAAQIAAAERLRAAGVRELGLLFVADEEQNGSGARAANRHPRARDCRWLINGEPTENKLATGTKGSLRLRLVAEGRSAHSAYPELGHSAIDDLLAVLAELRAARWPTDPLFGETTCNVGVIAGGTRPNVISDAAHADLQIRLVGPVEPVRDIVERAARGRARVEVLTAVPPTRLTTVPGFETALVRYATDIPNLFAWGTPLLLGPGSILVAHTPEERIAKADLAQGVELYERLARALLAMP
jgi:acetylornithine deacetylase